VTVVFAVYRVIFSSVNCFGNRYDIVSAVFPVCINAEDFKFSLAWRGRLYKVALRMMRNDRS